eukprot:gene17613-23946_t
MNRLSNTRQMLMAILRPRPTALSRVHSNMSADDDGEPKTQAYNVIKAAQEREELQREGDTLDAKIRKAEKEVAALEATLVQMMGANHKYGGTFKKVDDRTSFTERAVLREKLDRAYDKLKFRRQEEAAIIGDLQQAEARLAGLSGEHRNLQATMNELLRRKAEAERQVDEQNEKLKRSRRAADKLLSKMTPESPQNKEASLAEVRDLTRAMLAELASLAAAVGPQSGILEAAEAVGIRLPAVGGGSRGGSGTSTPVRAGSRASSIGGSRPASARSQISTHSFGGGSMASPAGSRPASTAQSQPGSSRGGVARPISLGQY